MKKTTLITGAAGFIGSHLCDFYISQNHKVIGIDNLLTGSLNNICHLDNNSNFTFKKIDITSSFIIKEKIDYILHFASPASPLYYIKYPLETLRVGSIGTENILKLALKNSATILIASTSEVYGDPLLHPQNESYFGNVNPIGPRSVYDEAKRFQEAITCAYKRIYGLNVRIVRIFNTYGPRMNINDGRVVPNFIKQSLKNIPLTIYGNGSQTRSFCYIDDLINGIDKLLISNYSKPINLGNPDEISIKEFAKEIISLSEKKSKIIYKIAQIDDPLKRKPDISKAKEILRWQPLISRKEGLYKTYNYFKNLI